MNAKQATKISKEETAWLERMKLGEKISTIRKSKGITQRKVAQTTGIHFVNIHKIENGKINVTIDKLNQIASAIGCHIDVVENDE